VSTSPPIGFLGVAFTFVAVASTAVAQFAVPPSGRPVTAKDISGKKICFDSGSWLQFNADGSTLNYAGQRGKWSVPRPGVIKTARGERETEVLPDGQFHEHRKSYYGSDVDHWAKKCD
jgi:hypothetical protein